MERFGYVKKGSYEKVLRERDRLKRSIGELEDKITVLEADKNRLKNRVDSSRWQCQPSQRSRT